MSQPEEPSEVDQQQLWDDMHGRLDSSGNFVGRSLVTAPNDLAIILAERLVEGANLIEVGCANGRDARYWASHKGILVYALDFSQIALDQLDELARNEGVSSLITTGLFDANIDDLPGEADSQDAFYARSALHVTSSRLTSLLYAAHTVLRPGGLVAIEGKHVDDAKIKRSVQVNPDDPFLLSDPFEDGHVRRAWEPKYTQDILSTTGFEVTDLDVVTDQTDFADPSIFTRVIAVKS